MKVLAARSTCPGKRYPFFTTIMSYELRSCQTWPGLFASRVVRAYELDADTVQRQVQSALSEVCSRTAATMPVSDHGQVMPVNLEEKAS